jgi:hypothetical protein
MAPTRFALCVDPVVPVGSRSSGGAEARPRPVGEGCVRSGALRMKLLKIIGERETLSNFVGEVASGIEQESASKCRSRQEMNGRKEIVPRKDFSGIILVLYRHVLACIRASLCMASHSLHCRAEIGISLITITPSIKPQQPLNCRDSHTFDPSISHSA